jgi:photosystem II stability/assembly factor-like uncharacterized protein
MNKQILISLLFLIGSMAGNSQQFIPLMDDIGNTTATGISPSEKPNSQSLSEYNPWTSAGPFGGDVVDLAIDPVNPDLAFAAAGYPYMRNGNSNPWMIMDNLSTLSPSGIHCFEFTPAGVLFAGGNNSFATVFRSEDNGISWVQKNLPYNGGLLHIAVDPSNSDKVYAALSSNLSTTQNKVIIKSDDAGQTWVAFDMTSILPIGWSCVYLAVDPANSQTLFAIGRESFSNAKVIASFDGGTTWADKTAGLPPGKPLNSITIANGIVFVTGGQLFGGNVMGVYRSENYGNTWQNISTGFPSKVANDLIVHPADANKIYVATEGGGIYYTVNGGLTWNYNTGGVGNNGSVRKLHFSPGNPSVIYAGFLSLGVCMSLDGGGNWISSSVGIASLSLNDIEVDPNDPDVVLTSFEAENSGGCYLFDGSTQEWNLVSGLPATRFSAVDIGIDGTLYAWSNGPTSIADEGLYKSMDGGVVWQNMGPNIGPVFETQIWSIALSKTDPNLIFISGNNFGANGWASIIYRSYDGGANWANVYQGADNDAFRYVYIVPEAFDQIIFAAFKTESGQAGFIKSVDGGENWTPASNGLPANLKWAGSVVSDPQNPQVMYGGVGGYGDIGGKVYRSNNSGALWEPTNLSLGNYCKITDLIISPDNPDVIYAATTQSGVYFTMDGMNWAPSNTGLPATNITGFSRFSENSSGEMMFYTSTFTNSAFWTLLYEPGTTGVGFASANDSFKSIYPNPSKGIIYIDLSTSAEFPVEIVVYDLTGKQMKDYTVRNPSASHTELNLALPSGIYLLKINNRTNSRFEKIVITD